MILGLFLNLFLLNKVFVFWNDDFWMRQPKEAAAFEKGLYVDYRSLFPIYNAALFPNSFPKAQNSKAKKFFPPVRKDFKKIGVDITAKAAILMDRNTKTVLYQKNDTQSLPIASISKLVSALVFLDKNPKLTGDIWMTASDYKKIGRRFLYKGEHFYIKDVFYAALAGSDNNAIKLLAKSTGLDNSGFVNLMNKKARSLGMKGSHFVEPTGLSKNNVSTAYDLALLLDYVSNSPEIKAATIMQKYVFYPLGSRFKRVVTNTDELLSGYLNQDPFRLLVGKTGYIQEAGYCFSAIISNDKEKSSLIAVVLGSSDEKMRFQDLKSLVTWGFDNFQWEYGIY